MAVFGRASGTMPAEFIDRLKAAASAIGVFLEKPQLEAFIKYQNLLAAAGRTTNLTAIPKDRYLDEHFIDSLTLFQTKKIKSGQKIADIGTGAGFPGVPIKIVLPDIQLHLIEANGKKVEFLRRLTAALELRQVFIHQLRAEEAARQPEFREKMDIVTARAVAGLPVLLEYGLPLCQVGGWFLSLKGPKLEEEIESAKRAALELGGLIDSTYTPFGRPEAIRRVIVIVRKVTTTGDKYPRRAGVPARRPLGG